MNGDFTVLCRPVLNVAHEVEFIFVLDTVCNELIVGSRAKHYADTVLVLVVNGEVAESLCDIVNGKHGNSVKHIGVFRERL